METQELNRQDAKTAKKGQEQTDRILNPESRILTAAVLTI